MDPVCAPLKLYSFTESPMLNPKARDPPPAASHITREGGDGVFAKALPLDCGSSLLSKSQAGRDFTILYTLFFPLFFPSLLFPASAHVFSFLCPGLPVPLTPVVPPSVVIALNHFEHRTPAIRLPQVSSLQTSHRTGKFFVPIALFF